MIALVVAANQVTAERLARIKSFPFDDHAGLAGKGDALGEILSTSDEMQLHFAEVLDFCRMCEAAFTSEGLIVKMRVEVRFGGKFMEPGSKRHVIYFSSVNPEGDFSLVDGRPEVLQD